MTQTNKLTTQPSQPASLAKWMLLGAGVALTVITLFLYGVRDPNPAWGKLWMIRPLIIVPLAGAMGGTLYYFMNYVLDLSGWKKILAFLLSLIGYLIGLWLGIILGLDGTLWN
jgi:hypothetical protein